ncbi:glutathione S-transferase 1-like isoform X1 [Ischnura elegans]|uniref:glutathione S-transferase 1-like isoform X1 n=1 Tax=Ischnura elegans TaxID=197161 RepID=UPI001ED8BBE4|nr:glutathione S-transferase 1-like isoform X1 [Ischnura elegans]
MPLDLYYLDASPPVRAVLLAGKTLGVEFNLKFVDLFKLEQRSPEFLKINPRHTVPTLVDDGFVLWDSHAIVGYLANKYGKDDSLYPKDPKARAIVDEMLHFDNGTLFPRLRNITFPLLFRGKKELSPEAKQEVEEAYAFMEKFLEERAWVAGNNMTIADFCCVSSITSLECLVPGIASHPKLAAWVEKCKRNMVGYEEANQKGLDNFNLYVRKARGEA